MRAPDPRPSMIACRTVIGRGIAAHRRAARRPQRQAASSRTPMRRATSSAGRTRRSTCPPTCSTHGAKPGRRSEGEYSAWQARVAALPAASAREFERVRRAACPKAGVTCSDAYRKRARSERERRRRPASRCPAKSSICSADACPNAWSAARIWKRRPATSAGCKPFTADDHGGAYVHCGVREHLMGAMANGMAAHGGVHRDSA